MVARASAMMKLDRQYLWLGVERRKADVSLYLSFQLDTPTPLWLGCREMALSMTYSLSSSLAHWSQFGPDSRFLPKIARGQKRGQLF